MNAIMGGGGGGAQCCRGLAWLTLDTNLLFARHDVACLWSNAFFFPVQAYGQYALKYKTQ